MTEIYENAKKGADFIVSKYPENFTTPKVAIICGTGLGGIANILHPDSKVEIPYGEIPGFMKSTGMIMNENYLCTYSYIENLVQGHAGKLILGYIGSNKIPVICMVGRFQ